jgi:hypothetical protein
MLQFLYPLRPECERALTARFVALRASGNRRKEACDTMPAKTEKQRKFMGAELERKREGKKTRTGMSEKELEKMASKKKD